MDSTRLKGYRHSSRHPMRDPTGARSPFLYGEVNVDIAPSLARTVRLALIGLVTAFAWILISLVLGLSGGHAQAAENDDEPGLLGAVTSLLDTTTTALTDTVSTVGGSVSEVVGSVVAVTPAPVQQPVTETVNTVGSVVTAVTAPTAATLGGGVVTAVVEPVVTEVVQPTTELVSGIPTVGDLVVSLRLDRALLAVGTTLDSTLGATLDTVVAITAPVVVSPAGPDSPSAALPALSLEGAGASPAVAAASGPTGTALALTPSRGSAVPADAFAQASPPSTFTAGLCLLSSATSGPAGAGSGAWALVAMVPFAAHRAWVRRAGLSDDRVPPAPAASTDVSPD